MNYPKYGVSQNYDLTIFEFSSIGFNGVINKIVKFIPTNNDLIYNLGFGDAVEITEINRFGIDDIAISNNGDRNKILATIANTIFVFTQYYPERYVYFKGTTHSRTRLYRMVISNNLIELSKVFNIFGIVNDPQGEEIVVNFSMNVDFIGFLIKRR